MNLIVVSNLGEWSAFFEEILKLHKSKKNSPFHDKDVRWPINLINTATTRTRGGQQFAYFDAVDKGRAPIGKVSQLSYRKGFLVFADRTGFEVREDEKVFTNRVAGTQGANIRGLALAATYADFDAKIVRTMNLWFEQKRESIIEATGNKRTPRVRLAKPRHRPRLRTEAQRQRRREAKAKLAGINNIKFNEASEEDLLALGDAFLESVGRDESGEEAETEIVPEYEATSFQESQKSEKAAKGKKRPYRKAVKKLLDKSGDQFLIDEFERRGLAAAARAANAEQARQARLVSASNAFKFGSPLRAQLNESFGGPIGPYQRIAVKHNPVLEAFYKIPNWLALAAIFVRISGDQVEEVWKANTPVRSDTKLVYVSGGGKELLRPPGGRLRNSYKLVTDRELTNLIGPL